MLPSTFLSWGKAGTSPAGAIPVLSHPERSALLWFDGPRPLAGPCSLTEGGLPSRRAACTSPSAIPVAGSGVSAPLCCCHPLIPWDMGGTPGRGAAATRNTGREVEMVPSSTQLPKSGAGDCCRGVGGMAGCAGVPWAPLAQPQCDQPSPTGLRVTHGARPLSGEFDVPRGAAANRHQTQIPLTSREFPEPPKRNAEPNLPPGHCPRCAVARCPRCVPVVSPSSG